MSEPICSTCDRPIERVGETRSGLALWDHTGGPAGHDANPKPQCHKCGSYDFPPYETNWGFGNRCGSCGYDWYYSLGD